MIFFLYILNLTEEITKTGGLYGNLQSHKPKKGFTSPKEGDKEKLTYSEIRYKLKLSKITKPNEKTDDRKTTDPRIGRQTPKLYCFEGMKVDLVTL